MKTYIFSTLLFALTFVFSTDAMSIVKPPKKMYKTVDETGKTSFSDSISPEDAKYHRETLNKQGRAVEVTEQEKSKEQQEREKHLQALRKKQEKIIQSQKARDESLLRSYHSKEEMEAELQEKLKTLESRKKLIELEMSQHIEQLDTTQKKAATYERNAQPIPKNIVQEIASIQAEIERTKNSVKENLAAQEKLTAEYQVNIRRFVILTQKPDGQDEKDKISSIEEAEALGLFRCENDHQCKKAWEIARVFVDSNATTPADVNTDQLIMHALPTKDSDFSLSIAKLSGRHEEIYLFLDIHCRESSLGKELCASKKIQDLRSSFRPYVNERLSKLPINNP